VSLTAVTYDGLSMAFQALLFCPDDKTARTVTQVLSELEFNVEPCTEPFAAVKKLMSDHFDALVVDCDNEQNATLLFKSARNSTSNQTSLAVAIVEGQAGVAKAFRIGANLVLTKPINVEQSKGTLRVARGLLRKGEPVKPGAQAPAAPATPAATAPAPPAKPAAPRPVTASSTAAKPPATLAAATAARRPVQAPPLKPTANNAAAQVSASSGLAEADEVLDIKGTDSTHASPTLTAPPTPNKITPSAIPAKALAASSGFSGAASAPAPARETQVSHVSPASAPHKEDSLEKPAEVASSPAATTETESAPAPSFTFGGANAPEESDGGRKKIFIGIAAAVLVVGLAYAGYSHFKGGASQPVSQATTAAPTAPSSTSAATPASPKPAPEKPVASAPTPVAQPVTQPADVNSQPTTTLSDSDAAAEESTPTESKTTAKTSNSVLTTSKSAASAKAAPSPLVVKGGAVPKTKAAPAAPDAPAPDAPAPNVIGMAPSTSSGVLSGLVGNGNAPKPVLQSVNISQGVSQGLLVKKVQPIYPKSALTMRIEGVVELMATISKSGDIASVKVLKGDPQLTRAATDAVKQWKYKPYLLNGEPVEITTQVTVNFKLPN
jgi:TonB family protein